MRSRWPKPWKARQHAPRSGNASDFTKATDDIRTYADNLRNITNELDAAAKSVVASQELRLESAE